MKPSVSILRSSAATAALLIAGYANPGTVPPECPTPHNVRTTSYEGYRLVWADEFNEPGRALELRTGIRPQPRASMVSARQCDCQKRLPDHHRTPGERVDNLTYDSLSPDWRHRRSHADFTSSCLTTERSFQFRYGRLEVQARIPVTSGAWPAIWALGNRWKWLANGEIDLMEFYRRDEPIILANACWQGPQDGDVTCDEATVPYARFTQRGPQWASKFHLWRMDWDADRNRLSLDGELLNEIDLRRADCGGTPQRNVNPFSNDSADFSLYILLNLALGSNRETSDLSEFPPPSATRSTTSASTNKQSNKTDHNP